MVLERFFARSGKYPAYAMYEIEHFIMLLVCAIGIIAALFSSRKMNKEQILKRIKKCAILLLVSEILSIIFNFFIESAFP